MSKIWVLWQPVVVLWLKKESDCGGTAFQKMDKHWNFLNSLNLSFFFVKVKSDFMKRKKNDANPSCSRLLFAWLTLGFQSLWQDERMIACGKYEPNVLWRWCWVLAVCQGDFLSHIKPSHITVTGWPLSLNRKCRAVSGPLCICRDILGGGQTDHSLPPSFCPLCNSVDGAAVHI